MTKTIRLSKLHGLNPSVQQCYVCMKDVAVVFFGSLKGGAKAPRTVCLDRTPCPDCRAWMSQGVILISVRDGESGDNPYRTGGWCVLKDEAIRKAFTPPEFAESVLKDRMVFVPDSAWKMLGLPEHSQKAESSVVTKE